MRFWQFYRISRIIAAFSIAVFIGCNGSYGEETLIARAETLSPSTGDVIAVGEMSITADGRFLYFVYIQSNGATDLELGIAVAQKP